MISFFPHQTKFVRACSLPQPQGFPLPPCRIALQVPTPCKNSSPAKKQPPPERASKCQIEVTLLSFQENWWVGTSFISVTEGHTQALSLSAGQASQRGMAAPQALRTALHSNRHRSPPSLAPAPSSHSFSPRHPLN